MGAGRDQVSRFSRVLRLFVSESVLPLLLLLLLFALLLLLLPLKLVKRLSEAFEELLLAALSIPPPP